MAYSLGVVSSSFVASRLTGIRHAADAACLLPARALRVLRNLESGDARMLSAPFAGRVHA
jgi:hypothetical protein